MKNQKGFTLIELLIVMMIFSFLITSIFVAFFQFRNMVLLSGSTKQLQDVLLSTRRDAIDNVVPEGFDKDINSFHLNYYEVRFDFSNDSFYSRANVTDLLTAGNPISYFPPGPVGNNKKSEYSSVGIDLDSGQNCTITSSVLVVKMDGLTGELSFYNSSIDQSEVNKLPDSVQSCTVNMTLAGRTRKMVINKIDRTFDIQ